MKRFITVTLIRMSGRLGIISYVCTARAFGRAVLLSSAVSSRCKRP